MDFTSFVTSLMTSLVIFVVLMLLFTWLSRRPGNAVVYCPNRILKGMEPWSHPGGPRGAFAWIREAMASTERDVVEMSGVDTAVYFIFLGTVLGIFVLSGLVLLPVLLPIASTDHTPKPVNSTTSNGTFSDLDKLSMGNVAEKSTRLWGYLIAVYWVSIVTYFLLWKAYHRVALLRAKALMSPEAKPEQFAVLVRDIPPSADGQSVKEQVDSYFKAIYPESFYRSMIVTCNKKVNKIHNELEGYKKKLAHAEAVYEESKQSGKSETARPTTRTGFLGLIGKKVDSIEYFNDKINETIPKLEAQQKVTLKDKQKAAAVVFFNNRVAAASAGQSLHAQMVDTWTVSEAPEARQIIWTNLPIKLFERQIRQYVVYFIVALTIFFYMIPITFVSAFTTLDNLTKYLPFIKPVVKISVIKTVLEAYLPQIALIVFLAMLPKLLLFLSKQEGIASKGHAIRATSGKYFYFTVLNVFIGVTIGSSLFSSFKDIENHPNSLVDKLASSLPGSATFFLTYVALQFFVGYGLELSRLVPLIIFHLKRKYLCKTEDELKEAWAPGDLGYETRIPSDMLIVTIVLCYSVIAPLILPFGVLYFGLGWLVLRNQALKVFVPSFETYGRMWPHLHTRIVAALILYQVTMFGYFGLKKFIYFAILIPLPIISLIFAYVCSQKFYRAFSNTALEVACQEVKGASSIEEVFRSFIPASLCSDKADEDQFEDALSQVSRMGSFA